MLNGSGTGCRKPKPISPGSAGFFSKIAQLVVIVLALAVLAYVVKLFLPRCSAVARQKRKDKAKARIVLGERLEPDQSALDLLSEAEALARRGELARGNPQSLHRAAGELGDRKIISLAQYKTNRDYLRAVREIEPLYGNVKQLTDSFERHWYGLAHATETIGWRFAPVTTSAIRYSAKSKVRSLKSKFQISKTKDRNNEQRTKYKTQRTKNKDQSS